MSGDPCVGEQVGEPAPPEGGLERDLERGRLQLAKDPDQLLRARANPASEYYRAPIIEGHHLSGLAMKVHSDVDHDWASFLSLVPERTVRLL